MRGTIRGIWKRSERPEAGREKVESAGSRPGPTAKGIGSLRLASLAVWASLFGVFFVFLRPGIFITDTYGQYTEALSFTFHDWHPPVMAFLWSLLQPLAGASSMLLFHLLLYWGAFALVSDLCVREFHRFPLSLLVVSLLPTSLLHLAYVWKDTGLAVSMLGLLVCFHVLRRSPASRWGWLAAVLCAYYAVNVRHFALAAVFPILGMFLIPIIRIRKPAFRQWVAFLAAGLGLGLGLFLAGRAFDKLVLRSSPNTASHIQYFDMVGTLARARAMREFPREFLPDPTKWSELEAAYWSDPCNADLYSGWGRAAGLVRVDVGDQIDGPWLRTILAHPAAYLRHRLAFAGKLLLETDPVRYDWVYCTTKYLSCII